MGPVRLYFRYVGFSIRSQMQYRASSLLHFFGQLAITGIEFLAMWALFDRFGQVKGFTLPEVAMLYGMANVSMALAEAIVRGFDTFENMVKTGEFDRVLLRPRSTALQILALELQLTRFGRMLQGLVVLVWAAASMDVAWTAPKIALLTASVLSGACIFGGLFILRGAASFWTIESLEIFATVTYGGVETAQYPIVIYAKPLRRFFTYIIPLACMNYFPSLAITGAADPLGSPPWLPWVCPLVGFVFLILSLQVWEIGVRHYRSTGS
jgi:ABC-2 type transport system permease protein